jgi:hypothetical protein
MTEATKTRGQLVTRALVKLTVIGSGQSPDSEDTATVDDAVDGVLADLSARGVIDVPDDDAIPTEWFEDLATLLAQAVANDFGKEADPVKVQRAEMALIKKTVPGPTYQTQRGEYF